MTWYVLKFQCKCHWIIMFTIVSFWCFLNDKYMDKADLNDSFSSLLFLFVKSELRNSLLIYVFFLLQIKSLFLAFSLMPTCLMTTPRVVIEWVLSSVKLWILTGTNLNELNWKHHNCYLVRESSVLREREKY